MSIHGDISNSTIYGTAGTDDITLNGIVTGTHFEGGDGMDILHLANYTASDGSHHFSLNNFTNTDQNVLHSFEILDFTGGENNILSIDTLLSNLGTLNTLENSKLGDISNYSGKDLTNSTVLRVTGDSGDTVNPGNNDHASWSNQGLVTYEGINYNVYYDVTNGQHALIDSAIQTVFIT